MKRVIVVHESLGDVASRHEPRVGGEVLKETKDEESDVKHK